MMLGEVAKDIQIGRLLTMHAAWNLDQGDHAQKEVSMAKIHVADTLHKAADTGVQLLGAKGYSKDTVLEWIYRYARAASWSTAPPRSIGWCWPAPMRSSATISGSGAFRNKSRNSNKIARRSPGTPFPPRATHPSAMQLRSWDRLPRHVVKCPRLCQFPAACNGCALAD